MLNTRSLKISIKSALISIEVLKNQRQLCIYTKSVFTLGIINVLLKILRAVKEKET
jgi:hypothetical protein